MNNISANQTQVPHKYRLSPIYRFFCWCSGARLYLLKSCPTDYNKYFGIGIIVFLTGMMASLTGFYALFLIFNSFYISLVFGIFWGILIFFLDWFIVGSLKKENRFFSELVFATPRLILAVLLAIVISRPLELKLFEKEINGMLQSIQSENSIQYNKLIDKEYGEISALKAENQRLSDEIVKKEEYRSLLFNLMIEEAEGRSATNKVGKGLVYKEKKTEYDKVDSELSELKLKNNRLIEENLKTLTLLEQNKLKQVGESNLAIRQADGLLARFEAMSELNKKNNSVRYASWFIFILFILIEASPILVKLLSQRGPYDELFEKEEYEKLIEYKKQKVKAEVLANNYLELLKQKDELQFEAEKRNNENLIKEIETAKDEINRVYINKWKQKEIDSLPDVFDNPEQKTINNPDLQENIQTETVEEAKNPENSESESTLDTGQNKSADISADNKVNKEES